MKHYTANIEIGTAQEISDSMFPHVTVETCEIDDDGDQVIRLHADSQADTKQLEEWLQHDSRVRGWIDDDEAEDPQFQPGRPWRELTGDPTLDSIPTEKEMEAEIARRQEEKPTHIPFTVQKVDELVYAIMGQHGDLAPMVECVTFQGSHQARTICAAMNASDLPDLPDSCPFPSISVGEYEKLIPQLQRAHALVIVDHWAQHAEVNTEYFAKMAREIRAAWQIEK